MKVSRRSFLGTVGSGVAAMTVGAASTETAVASAATPLVYEHADWKFAEFDKLLKFKGRGKQMYDLHGMDDGSFFNAMKNSINGLVYGYGVPADEIKLVTCTHGSSNLMNFDDSMWEKYKIGELAKVTDRETGKPALRNVYYPKKNPKGSTDLNDRKSIYQDDSIEALLGRGLQLICCHNATTAQANALIKQNALTVSVEEVVADLQTHTLPGVIVVPAMVAAISMLQSEGHYTYIMAP
jgi:intracellular sulfur oxidation DsrE/DsrF family protein